MNDTQDLVDNYLNGNLTEAKQGASLFTHQQIRMAFIDHCLYCVDTACAIADYLKGEGTYDAACKAEQEERID